MSTITTRSGKGSPLTNSEVDANFTNLNTDKLEDITSESIKDLSDVNSSMTPTDGQALLYDTTNGWQAESIITDVVGDTTPQLGGALDVNGNSIVSASNGDINLTPDGTGTVNLNKTVDVTYGNVSFPGTQPDYSATASGLFDSTAETSLDIYTNNSGYAGGNTGYVVQDPKLISNLSVNSSGISFRIHGQAIQQGSNMTWTTSSLIGYADVRFNWSGSAMSVTNGPYTGSFASDISGTVYNISASSHAAALDAAIVSAAETAGVSSNLYDWIPDEVTVTESSDTFRARLAGSSTDLDTFSFTQSSSSGIIYNHYVLAGRFLILTQYANHLVFPTASTTADTGITVARFDRTVQTQATPFGIVTTTNGNLNLDPNGSGKVIFKGNSTKGSGQFVLNCEQNSHGITIKGPPHSAAANYTLIMPDDDGSSGQALTTDGSGNLSWTTPAGSYTHPNHSGEVTSTGDGATVIADNVVDEANLKVSNTPTDGYVLTARSGNTGGMTWEAASGGGGSSTSALTETTFSATANQTAFVVSGGITNAANISVFQNGVKLEEGASKDYTASASTNTVTLNSGAAAGDVVEVLEYGQPNSITDLSDTPSSLGSAGQVLQVNSGATALEFADASSGSGVTVYTGLSGTDGTPSGATYLLNASNPSAGDLAYVTANTSLYQNNGNGWYRIAVINTTPTISSVADASSNTTPFTLEGGTNTVITVTASDVDEGTDLTYSHSVTLGSLNGTTVTQGTGASENVFTITPHASNATTFSITFTVSDSINAATSVAAFTLEFVVTDSHFTSLLMATDGSAGDNNDITDSSSSNHTITVNGDANAGTFSPYRHGGYSYEFDGSTDSIRADDHTDFDWSSSGFTIECWINMKAMPSGGVMTANHQVLFSKWNAYSNNREFLLSFGSNGTLGLVLSTDGTNYTTTTSSNNVLSLNTWHHICYEFDGSSHIVYVDGTAEVTVNNSSVPYAGNMPFGIGYSVSGGNAALHIVPQSFVTDVRVVNGSTVYGGAFTPPTERLTAITNTSLLTCHLPYIADGSSNAHSITINGDPETKPFGPYDHSQYSESDNGGSVYFDGSGDYLTVGSNAAFGLGTGDFTAECWIYPLSVPNTYVGIFGTLNTGTPVGFTLSTDSSGNITYVFNDSVATAFTSNTTSTKWVANTWQHIAITRSSNSVRIFLNGTQIGTTKTDSADLGSSDDLVIGRTYTNYAGFYFDGYLSDVRIIKGTAVYSGAFTPPTGPLTATGGTYSSTTNVDTSITSGHTKLLLNGTDAHVIDKSQGNNLKLVGTAASTSALTSGSTPPYIGAAWANTSAVSFDGDSDYVIMPQISLGGGDFTIEAYTYLDARLTSYPAIFSNYNSFAAGALGLFAGHGSSTTTNYQVAHNGAGFPSINGGPITYDQWVHLCVERYNGTITLYKDGSSVNSFASTATLNGVGSNFYIGTTGDSISTGYLNGWIQDFRVTVGKARYQGAFTKPAAPLKG